jgi:hypothetical protein
VVDVPVIIHLHTSCDHVTGRRTIRLVRLELKVGMKKDGDFVDASQIYLLLNQNCHFSVSFAV